MSRKTRKPISRVVRECLSSSLTRPSPEKKDSLYNIMMRRLSIRQALSFDGDFRWMGFGLPAKEGDASLRPTG